MSRQQILGMLNQLRTEAQAPAAPTLTLEQIANNAETELKNAQESFCEAANSFAKIHEEATKESASNSSETQQNLIKAANTLKQVFDSLKAKAQAAEQAWTQADKTENAEAALGIFNAENAKFNLEETDNSINEAGKKIAIINAKDVQAELDAVTISHNNAKNAYNTALTEAGKTSTKANWDAVITKIDDIKSIRETLKEKSDAAHDAWIKAGDDDAATIATNAYTSEIFDVDAAVKTANEGINSLNNAANEAQNALNEAVSAYNNAKTAYDTSFKTAKSDSTKANWEDVAAKANALNAPKGNLKTKSDAAKSAWEVAGNKESSDAASNAFGDASSFDIQGAVDNANDKIESFAEAETEAPTAAPTVNLNLCEADFDVCTSSSVDSKEEMDEAGVCYPTKTDCLMDHKDRCDNLVSKCQNTCWTTDTSACIDDLIGLCGTEIPFYCITLPS